MFRDSGGSICPPKLGHTSFFVPCGQCLDCRLSRARSWATRCTHEASRWKNSSFITLTYRENPGTLCPIDARNFIRNLRTNIGPNFKYFLVGEYGENFSRPHYHALIFGYDFGFSEYQQKSFKYSNSNLFSLANIKESFHTSDLTVLENTSALASQQLSDIWGYGFASVGELTFDSAMYCSQYATKKLTGAAKSKYQGRYPEFHRQSRNAIGKEYAIQYADEIISNNQVMSNGIQQPIPPYYLKLFEKLGKNLDELRATREEFSSSHTLEKSYTRASILNAKFGKKFPILDSEKLDYVKRNFYFAPPNRSR